MMRVGFVGSRGMVGSVLLQRMLQENDFALIEPAFFSASNVGGEGPAIGKPVGALKDAHDISALKAQEVIITCQGGDYTTEIYPQAARGRLERLLDRRRQDAAHAGRRGHHSRSGQPPGDRCGAGPGHPQLHRRQLHGEPDDDGARRVVPPRPDRMDDLHDLSGCIRRRRAEHARAAAADGRSARRGHDTCSSDPDSAILDIDREVAGILRDARFPTEYTGVPLAGSLIPWIDRDLGNGMSLEEWKGGAETNKILGRAAPTAIPVESLCVRIGAMRCHSQAHDDQAPARYRARRDRAHARAKAIAWVRVVPNTRAESIKRLTPAAVTGHVGGADRAAAQACDGAGISWRVHRGRPAACGARPNPCAACCASCCNVDGAATGVGLAVFARSQRRAADQAAFRPVLCLGARLERHPAPRRDAVTTGGKRLPSTLLLSTTSCASLCGSDPPLGPGPPHGQARRAPVKAIFAAKNRANTEV